MPIKPRNRIHGWTQHVRKKRNEQAQVREQNRWQFAHDIEIKLVVHLPDISAPLGTTAKLLLADRATTFHKAFPEKVPFQHNRLTTM